MNRLHKDGIRAAMSENTERETLKRMGQRGETVSNDTQVKREDKVPGRTDVHCVCCPDDPTYTGKWKGWDLYCAYEPTHWMPLPPVLHAPASTVAPQQSDDGWVTFGRVKVDIENETETFERIYPPAPASPAAIRDEAEPRSCVKCGHFDETDSEGRCISIYYGAGGDLVSCGCVCAFPVARETPSRRWTTEERAELALNPWRNLFTEPQFQAAVRQVRNQITCHVEHGLYAIPATRKERCVRCNHAATYRGHDGRCRAIVLGPDAMQGSGMAHCGCQCESITTTPPSTPIDVSQQHDFVQIVGSDRCGLRGCTLGVLEHAWIPPLTFEQPK